jgi:hypothetical protein
MARDLYHQLVRDALEKQGWKITHDPYYLDLDNRARIEIDLGAEKLICAEKDSEKIVVEVKSFLNRSITYDFHGAYGQFRIYRRGVAKAEPNRILFMAMPQDIFSELELRPFYMDLIQEEEIKLIIFNPFTKQIVKWIN